MSVQRAGDVDLVEVGEGVVGGGVQLLGRGVGAPRGHALDPPGRGAAGGEHLLGVRGGQRVEAGEAEALGDGHRGAPWRVGRRAGLVGMRCHTAPESSRCGRVWLPPASDRFGDLHRHRTDRVRPGHHGGLVRSTSSSAGWSPPPPGCDDAAAAGASDAAGRWRVRIAAECRRLESARRKRPWVQIPHPPQQQQDRDEGGAEAGDGSPCATGEAARRRGPRALWHPRSLRC